MRNTIFVSAIIPADFRINSKQDAKQYLSDYVCKGSHFTIPDVNNPGMHLVISRHANDGMAHVAYETDKKEWYEPDLMRSGQDAIDLVYNCRRAVNAYHSDKG